MALHAIVSIWPCVWCKHESMAIIDLCHSPTERIWCLSHNGRVRAVLVTAPCYVRTELAGPEAYPIIKESIPTLANVVPTEQGKPRLVYLDCRG